MRRHKNTFDFKIIDATHAVVFVLHFSIDILFILSMIIMTIDLISYKWGKYVWKQKNEQIR